MFYRYKFCKHVLRKFDGIDCRYNELALPSWRFIEITPSDPKDRAHVERNRDHINDAVTQLEMEDCDNKNIDVGHPEDTEDIFKGKPTCNECRISFFGDTTAARILAWSEAKCAPSEFTMSKAT